MSYTNYPNGITSMGVPIFGSKQDISGSTYFVDNNSGSDSNDGTSFDRAYKTLAYAISISNIDIARGSDRWARRNTIYYSADSETASLTVFPAKCDVIGVGSCDAYPMASIKGKHVTATEHLGCRFVNVRFRANSAGALFTLSAYDNGISFYKCQFIGVESTLTASYAILTAACELLTIQDCDFDGAFSAQVIYIGTGNASGLKIIGNRIRGGASGGIYIKTDATFTGVNGKGIIDDNKIYVAAITIQDVPGLCIITNNRCITAASSGTAGASSFVANTALCSGNQVTASNISFMYPLAFSATGTS